MVVALVFILFFLVIYLTRPNNRTGVWIDTVVHRFKQFQQNNPLYFQFLGLQKKAESKTDITPEPVIVPIIPPVSEIVAPIPNRAISELTGRVYTTPITAIDEKLVTVNVTDVPQIIVPITKTEPFTYNSVPVSITAEEEKMPAIVSVAKAEPEVDQDAVNQLLKLIENVGASAIVPTPQPIPTRKPSTPTSAPQLPIAKAIDPDIIDIDLTVRRIVHEPGSAVPIWPHSYVYSIAELQRATAEQIAFYARYKACFLKGEHLDLEGNTNYGFILYYDLLGEYEKHKDLAMLERQLGDLEISCPRTRSYAHSYLIHQYRITGKYDEANRIAGLPSAYQSNRPDGESWDWKIRNAKRLKLGGDEVKILANVWISSNNFVNIDFCNEQLTKLYIGVIKAMRAAFTRQGTSEQEQFDFINDLVARKQYRYHKGSANYNQQMEYGVHTTCMYIFRYCESVLRTHYGHKRKVDLNGYFNEAEVMAAFQERVLAPVLLAIPELLPAIDMPDEVVQMELNKISPTRWKDEFELTEAHYNQSGRDQFIIAADRLVELNSKNPSLDVVCMELSKFLAGYDKPSALRYYLMHCHHCFKVKKTEPKALTKTVQKILLANDAQTERLSDMVTQLKLGKEIKAILDTAKEFYEPVRKKIVLDPSLIRQVEQQHSGTVELLNEYLKDEEPTAGTAMPTLTVEEQIVAVSVASPLKTNFLLDFNLAQSDLLALFKTNDFVLGRDAVAAFCKTAGAMLDPLINGINEACYDLLDDTLIEEDGEEYLINLSYYNQLLNL